MYCRKCGKQIDYDSEFCIECKAEAAAKAAYAEVMKKGVEGLTEDAKPLSEPVAARQDVPVAARPAPKNPRLYGLAKGVLSASFGLIAAVFAIIALIIFIKISLPVGGEITTMPVPDATPAINSILGYLSAAALLNVPSLVFGILSVVSYKRCVKAGWGKPTATLVLGIIGLACCLPTAIIYML